MKVFNELNPSQMVVKIVHDELKELLGSDDSELHLAKKPTNRDDASWFTRYW